MTRQHDAGIVDKQGVDIDDVAGYQLVVWVLAERHQGAGDNVDKAPGELAEGRRVTFAGKLSGEARCHFRYTAKAPDGIVAGGDFRISQMKQDKAVAASGALSFRPQTLKQIGIAFWIENDHHLATADVLGGKQFRQPGFADAGGTEHQRVAGAFTELQGDVVLFQFHAVQPRIAADGRQRTYRVQPVVGAEQTGKTGKGMFAAFFDMPCQTMAPSGAQPGCGFRLRAVVQTLGVDG